MYIYKNLWLSFWQCKGAKLWQNVLSKIILYTKDLATVTL